MHRLLFCIACIALALCAVGSAADELESGKPNTGVFGLDFQTPFEHHITRQYGVNEGLPSHWINAVLPTRDGYLWIGTDNGLVRYDGYEFKLVSGTRRQQSPSGDIRALCEDLTGDLWVGTAAGLYRYRHGTPGAYEPVASVPDVPVYDVFLGRDGAVWIGTLRETYRGVGSEFEVVEAAPNNVRAICETADGTLWIGSHRGLFRRRSGDQFEQIVHERLPDTLPGSGVPQSRVYGLHATKDGDLWVGTSRALMHWKDGSFTEEGTEIEHQQFYDIHRARNGVVYVAARFGLFRSFDGSAFEKVSDRVSAFCLAEDRDGRLWVGHGDNRGLHQYQNQFATDLWSEEPARCVFRSSIGEIWIGTRRGATVLRDNTVATVVDGLPDPRIQTIAEASGDDLWIATIKGVARWRAGKIVPDPVTSMTADMNVAVVLQDSSAGLWIALATAGTFHLQDGRLTELTTLPPGRTHWFWEDDQGSIWIGHESGLFRETSGSIRKIDDPALEILNQPRLMCHYQGSDGSLWIGTSNGILRLRGDRCEAFPPSCGLLADNIERIADDGRGRLWFGGRDGLFHVDIADLDAFSEGRLDTVTSYRVDGFQRFPPLRAFSQGCVVREGDLLIASETGLTRIPLESASTQLGPINVRVERVWIDGEETQFGGPFRFTSGPKRLAIEFSAPIFQHPEHVEFQYRLEGQHNAWTDPKNLRVISYTDLPPGRYRFRLRARHRNQSWQETAEPVEFTVTPRWWERTSVRFLGVILLITLASGYWLARLKRAKQINQKLQREIDQRTIAERESRRNQEQLARVSRVASMGELSTSIAHEVKQPLFAIVSNAQTARKLLDRDQPDLAEIREALQDIADDGNRASTIIDRIRALVKKEHKPIADLNLNQVAGEAGEFAAVEFRRRGLTLATDFEETLPTVSGDPIELQQVILNLLINAAQAMKDSQGRVILLRTQTDDGSVRVSVRDEGSGVPQQELPQLFEPFFTTKPEGMGMGLAINRTIIDAHRGRIWAEPNEDIGMTFQFAIPIDRENAGPVTQAEHDANETVEAGDGR